jgi:hypothetical protein
MLKNTKFGALKSLAVAGFVGVCSMGVSQGAISMRFSEVGGDVVMTASGTYDFSSAAVLDVNAPSLGGGALLSPTYFGWESGPGTTTAYSVTGSDRITIAPSVLASSSSATVGFFWYENTDAIHINNTLPLTGVVNNTATFPGQSFASLGMISGQTATFSWSGDSLTVEVGTGVPEPSSALLASAGLGLLAFRRKRK